MKKGEAKINLGIRKNKAQASLFTIIILILLVLLLIILIWNLIIYLLNYNSEEAFLKAELIPTRLTLKSVDAGTESINLTIQRGTGKVKLVSEEIVEKNSDIVFIIDTTYSMEEEAKEVMKIAENFSDKLNELNIDHRFAIVFFKDYGYFLGYPPGSYYQAIAVLPYNFSYLTTSNLNVTYIIYHYLSHIDGGGDAPEAHLMAINKSMELDFRNENNLKKLFIIVSDDRPHAKDCTCTSGTSGCYNGITYNQSYSYKSHIGPESIQEIENKLISQGIIIYYINHEINLCLNKREIDMVYKTGGKFYNYNDSSQLGDIILGLKDEINSKYETEVKWSYIKVMFYNGTASYEDKIYDVLEPLETKTYTIPKGEELSKHITNVNRIEIYPAILTDKGREIIGPMIGSADL